MRRITDLNAALEELQKHLHQIKKATMQEAGYLHSGELKLIKFIAHYHQRFNEAPSLVTISQVLGLAQATVTVLAERLIKKQLLCKESSALDKRVKLLTLTDEAHARLAAHQEQRLDSLRKLSVELGEADSEALTRIVKKINATLRTGQDRKE